MSDPSIGERIERSPGVQFFIAIAIVAVLLAQLAMHLPAGSAVAREIGGEANQIARIVGLESQWAVFAPNPRSTSLQIEGRVSFEDGAFAVWHLPEGARVGANLRYYRWRKWLERARSDDYRDLWEPTCQWIASLYDDHAAPVERVQLVRRFHENRVVGPQPPYDEFVYHTCTPADGRS